MRSVEILLGCVAAGFDVLDGFLASAVENAVSDTNTACNGWRGASSNRCTCDTTTCWSSLAHVQSEHEVGRWSLDK